MDDRYVIVIPADDEAILLHCDAGRTLELATLQELVEGCIETVPTVLGAAWAEKMDDEVVLIVNEEGKLRGLPVNEEASEISAILDDELVGNAVLMCARGDELIGFTKEDAENVLRQWF